MCLKFLYLSPIVIIRTRVWFGTVIFFLLSISSILNAHAAVKPQAILYITRTPTVAEVEAHNTHALYEPAVGCYIGAYIDFDSTLNDPYTDMNHTRHHDPARFEQIVGRQHAMYFFYLGYGKPLPIDWVRKLAARGKFVHIALEPNNGLNRVKDDAYLQKLADDMARSGAKIFLRFASEMNGNWTVYSKSPALFKEKFRLVHQIMHRRATNVAMVWCPYTIPNNNIEDFYPGDKWTDWVGINMYNVTFHDNSLDNPCENEHPADMVSQVYNLYSARKPMMICEYAATHYTPLQKTPRVEFAMRKILTLYNALPRIFPRVKCINYFDGNTLQFAAERAYNDYSITDDAYLIDTYRFATSPPYFITSPLISTPSNPPPIPMRMQKNELLQGRVKLSCWARTPLDFVSVSYKVDGYTIYKANRPDLWECFWDAGSVLAGKHLLLLEVRNRKGELVASQKMPIITRP